MLVEGDLWKLSSVASGREMLAVCTKHFCIMKAMNYIKISQRVPSEEIMALASRK